MTAKKDRPEFEALVPRIASGELTRDQAAAIAHKQTGLAPGSFKVWVSQNHSDTLRAVRRSAGALSKHSHSQNDPDKAKAYEQALSTLMAGKMPGPQVARKFGVSYTYLMRLAKKESSKVAVQPDSEVILSVLNDPARMKKLAEVIRALQI